MSASKLTLDQSVPDRPCASVCKQRYVRDQSTSGSQVKRCQEVPVFINNVFHLCMLIGKGFNNPNRVVLCSFSLYSNSCLVLLCPHLSAFLRHVGEYPLESNISLNKSASTLKLCLYEQFHFTKYCVIKANTGYMG